MSELIKDKRIKVLLHFIKLEKENFFVDKTMRDYTNIVTIMTDHQGYDKASVKYILNELIELGLITREYEKSIKRSDKYLSILSYQRKNKLKLKEMYDSSELPKYMSDEFDLLIIR